MCGVSKLSEQEMILLCEHKVFLDSISDQWGWQTYFIDQGFSNFTMTRTPIYQYIPAKALPYMGRAT